MLSCPAVVVAVAGVISLSATWTVKVLKIPVAVGVPVMAPLVANVNPGGRTVPFVSVQV